METLLRRAGDTARVFVVVAKGGAYSYCWCNRNGDSISVLNREGTKGYVVRVSSAYSKDWGSGIAN
jgi:hypothetical protein